jgi:hypothetical protein
LDSFFIDFAQKRKTKQLRCEAPERRIPVASGNRAMAPKKKAKSENGAKVTDSGEDAGG